MLATYYAALKMRMIRSRRILDSEVIWTRKVTQEIILWQDSDITQPKNIGDGSQVAEGEWNANCIVGGENDDEDEKDAEIEDQTKEPGQKPTKDPKPENPNKYAGFCVKCKKDFKVGYTFLNINSSCIIAIAVRSRKMRDYFLVFD